MDLQPEASAGALLSVFEPVGPPLPPDLQLPAAPETHPARPAPHRVLLIGDSLMQNGCLGSQLEARFKRYAGVSVDRWAKQSTGLARLDYFSWPAKLDELLAKHHPDLVIAVWGANDCQSVTNARGKALAVFGTAAWDEEYGARVEHVARQVQQAGGQFVLIGLPNMRNKNYGARIARLNGVAEKAAATAGAVYLPTWQVTSTGTGEIQASITYAGKTASMRQKDGIHLSNQGAAYVADYLCTELEQLFELKR